jgi:RimJ/RimL family protein N-acetyltransferase
MKAGPEDGIRIRGPRLLLRPLEPEEIDAAWQDLRDSDPIAVATPPDEAALRRRLLRSGFLDGGSLDLAVDLGGEYIGRIQTFVVAHRRLPPGVFELGIGLREHARGSGSGREAVALLTDWLFREAGATRVQAPTDPANLAMRAVFDHVGWRERGTLVEYGREWVLYALERREWEAAAG